jgi:hypothetical protein
VVVVASGAMRLITPREHITGADFDEMRDSISNQVLDGTNPTYGRFDLSW